VYGGIQRNIGPQSLTRLFRQGATFHHPLNRPVHRTGIWSIIFAESGPKQSETVVLETKKAEVQAEPDEVLRSRVEAVLFVTREPIASRKLAQLAGLADATQARTLTRQLNKLYDDGGHSMRIEEVAGGYQLLSRPQFAKWLRRLANIPGELRLSQPLLETLALVAYRQPVLRADIEAVRGVGCSEMLRQLMERDLVRIAGRSEELGRPYLYGTTKRFLQLFGLKSLDRLPRAKELRSNEPIFSRALDENVNSNQNVPTSDLPEVIELP
jgi:segregation and condensation protein B